MNKSSSRWLALGVLVIVLTAVGIQIANPHSYLSELVARIGEASSGPNASLTEINTIDQLKGEFNRADGHPRLILLLSPT